MRPKEKSGDFISELNYLLFSKIVACSFKLQPPTLTYFPCQLEEEITTLKQVLASKENRHLELKQKLGITPLNELRQNFSKSWYDMQTSTAYKKTSETLSTAGQRTSVAFSNLGNAINRKFGDMRNSPSFKSFEEKVESTVSNIKVRGAGNFEEVLSSAAQASAQGTPTNNVMENSER
uniref:Tumor protein D53 homolog n=1 Tax=Sinocyclocheilus grahami TaxID=75366 RepID=A0A672S4Y6_SINGR